MGLCFPNGAELWTPNECFDVGLDWLLHRKIFVFQETEAVYKPYAQRGKVALIIFIKALHVMVAPRKGIQDSLGLDSTLWIPDSRSWIPDCLSVEVGEDS